MILMIITLIISMTGCWNRRELPSLAIVLGLGLDKGEGKDKLDLTTQIVKTAELKTSSPEEGGSGGGSNGAGAYWNVKNSGDSVFKIIRDYTHKSSRKLYWPHNQVLIFGRSLAEEGISEYLDFFQRDQEARSEVFILVAEDKAGDIFDVKPKLEKVPSINISDLIDAQAATSQSSITRLYQFVIRLMSKTTAPIAPIIRIEGQGDNRVLVVSGTAIFKDDKMIGEMDKKETRGLLWVIDKVKSGIIDINCPDSEDKVSLEIIRSKGKITSKITDDKPHITVEIKEEGNIGSQACAENLASPDAVERLEEQESEAIKEEIEATLDKAKKLNADIFGFGDILHQRHPKEWQEMKDDWDDIFPNLDVEILVEAKIRRSGSLEQPAAPEKKE
ncbi:Ger(x)C family spore germination protein [Desulfosporosinus orientis]|nr:Ger(x)C family spore germination protein [Desulfosporosinus orientis]